MPLQKPPAGYQPYAIEALKVVVLCALSLSLLWVSNVRGIQLAMGFMMVAQTSFAVFFVPPFHYVIRVGAFPIIALSALAGGLLGFYFPDLSAPATVLAAVCTFYFVFINSIRVVCINAVLVLMIFGYFPFSSAQALSYLAQWSMLGAVYAIWHWLLYRRDHFRDISLPLMERNQRDRVLSTMVCLISLGIAYGVTALLPARYHTMHIYWIPMVCLLVTQVTVSSTITFVRQRIAMNLLGALAAAALFYVIHPVLWLEVSILVILFYLSLFLMFWYQGRTFCITIMMVGIYHVLEDASAAVMFDRILFTAIAGGIVLAVSFISFAIVLKLGPGFNLMFSKKSFRK